MIFGTGSAKFDNSGSTVLLENSTIIPEYSDRNISIKVSFPIKGLTRKRVPLCNFDI